MRTTWCDTCRGDADGSGDLLSCAGCRKKFHLECAGLRTLPAAGSWTCETCATSSKPDASLKTRVKAVRVAHTALEARSSEFFRRHTAELAPFVPAAKLAVLKSKSRSATKPNDTLRISGQEPYIRATLRSYQVDGINWILGQHALGVGGILGDEMGLGKTIQTLGFLSALKASGLPGPHLVVTPLAVLQNWANEIKKFTPDLTFVKVHGAASERDRLLADPRVLGAGLA